MNKKELSVILGLIFAIGISAFFNTNYTANKVRENTLRLHIIAASDSEQDQEVKLKVRDEILKLSQEIYFDTDSLEQAIDNTNDYMEIIHAVVNDTLTKNDMSYTGTASIEQYYFDTTKYTDFTLPKGEYTALTVKLGETSGKNWWCVVYPSLCIGTAAEYEQEEYNEFIADDKFEFKFKIVELFEDTKKLFSKNTSERYDKI